MLYYALVFLVVGVIAGALNLARGVCGCGSDFLGAVLGRDRVGRDPSHHRALRSDCLTGSCTVKLRYR